MAGEIEVQKGFKTVNPVPVDGYYGPYNNLAEARAGVPAAVRAKGIRKVGILQLDGSVIDYWWNGDLSDSGLVPYIMEDVVTTEQLDETLENYARTNDEVSFYHRVNTRNVLAAHKYAYFDLSNNSISAGFSVPVYGASYHLVTPTTESAFVGDAIITDGEVCFFVIENGSDTLPLTVKHNYSLGYNSFLLPNGTDHIIEPKGARLFQVRAGGSYQTIALLGSVTPAVTVDTVPTDGSSNPVSSNGVFDALAGKQDVLTFDNAPTSGSNNPVKSGGVYTALGSKVDKATGYGLSKNDYTDAEKAIVAAQSGVNTGDETASTIITKIGDGSGKIAATYLPSFVDDVIEGANLAALPATGETGKIYVTLDTNKTYRWSGSAYVEISASPGSTDAVTEGSSNLYFTTVRVLATLLSGLNTALTGAPSATDTILQAFGRISNFISNIATTVRGITLTGLDTSSATTITAADSVLSATGKLQAQISANSTAISTESTARQNADALKADKVETFFTTQTASFNIAAAMVNTTVRCNHATVAITATIPDDNQMAIGERLTLRQSGAASLSIAAAGGITLNSPQGTTLTRQYSSMLLTKQAANVYSVTFLGDYAIANDAETQISATVTEDNKVVSRLKLFNWWTWIMTQVVTWKANITIKQAGSGNPTPALKIISTSSSDGSTGNLNASIEHSQGSFAFKKDVYQAGGFGSAIKLTTSQFGSASGISGFTGSAMSIAFWYNAPDQSSARGLINCGGVIWISQAFGTISYQTNGSVFVANPSFPSANTWHHIAITSTNNSQIMYVNGAQVATASVAMNSFTNAAMTIGLVNGAYMVNGMIDQLLAYNKILTAGEISSIYNGGFGTSSLPSTAAANLFGRWEFDDGSGTTAIDSSGHTATMAFSGGQTWVANAKVPMAGSTQNGTVLSYNDAVNNSEKGIAVIGDVSSGTELQGLAIRMRIAGKLGFLVGSDFHFLIDPSLTSASPAATPVAGSYNSYSIWKIGAGGASVGQIQLAATSGFTPNTNHNGCIILDNSGNFRFVEGGTAYKNAYLDRAQTFTADQTVSGKVTANQFFVAASNTPPASATATGTAGEIRFGSDGYLYYCTATNTWVRTQLTTW